MTHLGIIYDPETGLFKWKKIGTGRYKPPGYKRPDGYIWIHFARKAVPAHRLAWFLIYGYWPSEIDHINQIRDDNRLCNLREVSHSQNRLNSKLYSTNKSGHRGVFWDRKASKWRVRVQGKYRGLFNNLEDARLVAESVYTRLEKP